MKTELAFANSVFVSHILRRLRNPSVALDKTIGDFKPQLHVIAIMQQVIPLAHRASVDESSILAARIHDIKTAIALNNSDVTTQHGAIFRQRDGASGVNQRWRFFAG